MTLTPEEIAGALGAIGAIVLMLNRIGLITFGGKDKGPPISATCPDPVCQKDVQETKKKVCELHKDMKTLMNDISFIKGFYEGKKSGI